MVEGPVPVGELLDAGAAIEELYVDLHHWESADDRSPVRAVVRSAVANAVPVWGVSASVFASVSDTNSPQGVLALARREPASISSFAADDGPVLVLVDVTDPGNAGTLLRAAEAAGCVGVVFVGDCTDPFGPKAVRAAAGSILRLPVAEVAHTADALSELAAADRSLIATVVSGGVAPELVALSDRVALVVGSEAHGLSEETIGRCDHTVTIPMTPSVESMNVAVAGAVVLFEAARQRRMAK